MNSTITRIITEPDRSVTIERTDDGLYILHIETADESVDQAGVMDFPLTQKDVEKIQDGLRWVTQ